MKLLFLGDTHGNTRWVRLVVAVAVEQDVDWIVQVGDFRYWAHKRHGVDYLDAVQQYLADASELRERPLQMVWIDGNHENHAVLREIYGPGGPDHQPHPEFGFWRNRDNLWHAPRGHRWTWDDVKFLSLGGAYSIDKEWRKPGLSWWPEELITEDELDGAIAGGVADFMVTHDCPAGVQGAIPEYGGLDRQKDRWPESLENRRKVARAVQAVRPFVLVHGHYHHRNSELYEFAYDENGEQWRWETRIEGLTCDPEGRGKALGRERDVSGAVLIWATEDMERRCD